ncbi:MAG: hypothetical protein KC486_32380, partial [Myxococcales bacterium]|nr:hypothetical protein [Myxococcales bacterium]
DEVRDAEALTARGVVYVPDFLCNRMGIVHCANEQYGYIDGDPAIERHFGRDWDNSLYKVTRRTLALAEAEGITTAAAAIRIADELARHEAPVVAVKTTFMLRSLVAGRWHERG